jgi:hypothetical protein
MPSTIAATVSDVKPTELILRFYAVSFGLLNSFCVHGMNKLAR